MSDLFCCTFWLIIPICFVGLWLYTKISDWFKATIRFYRDLTTFNIYGCYGCEAPVEDNRRDSIEVIAKTKVDKLVKEIIKARYCTGILGNPPYSEDKLAAKVNELDKLERQHPKMKRFYSPTQYIGYVEKMASIAYGRENWQEIKRTLDLTR